jgi:hypothetical protein
MNGLALSGAVLFLPTSPESLNDAIGIVMHRIDIHSASYADSLTNCMYWQ